MDYQIPKVIHYCWFGGNELPAIAKKCIESWKKYCPDFQVVEWNESNFDITSCDYANEAYKAQKWAFVSDYARLKIIYDNGGIYLDTDVEIIKPITDLLKYGCFLGTENTGYINSGLGFGARKKHPIIGELKEQYENIHFLVKEGEYDTTPCPIRNTIPLARYGYKYNEHQAWIKNDTVVFPPYFFSPMDQKTGLINVTEDSYSIHHYSALWLSDDEKLINSAVEEIENGKSIKAVKKIRKHIVLYNHFKKNGEINNPIDYVKKQMNENKRKQELIVQYKRVPKVTIISGYRWNYFHWFILGLHKLNDSKRIELSFRLPLFSSVLALSGNVFLCRLADKGRRLFEKDSYNMKGIIEFEDGKKKKFVIDSADAPYLFHSKDLEKTDVYFKMQCPIDLNENGFYLTPDILIPWLDHEHIDTNITGLTDKGERKKCTILSTFRYKIKPLLNATRALTDKGFSKKRLEEGYNQYYKARKIDKTKFIMCYFGNSLGPKLENNIEHPDFDWEADIMTYYGEKVSHPNEKRAHVSDFISALDNCDARIITRSNADIGIQENKELVIPLEDFCDFVSNFQYNINVSGYRLSIPSRFIESFIVGTGIVTDKLHVKWFRPFEEEVIETVEMGYLPMNEVDWDSFKKSISNVKKSNPSRILELFDRKWSPVSVANYIIDTVRNS